MRRPYATEVFSVDEVACINTDDAGNHNLRVLLLFAAFGSRRKAAVLLAGKKTSLGTANDEGTDMFLSLIDLSMRPVNPEANILSIRTTCTNRDLPSRLPFGNEDGDFELEGASSIKSIVALRKPTADHSAAFGKGALWRLISHLSLNYLSLVQEGTEALQQILRLYDIGQSAYSQNVIDSILRVKSSPHFARVSSENGITFARGTRVELQLDEGQFVGGGVFLFASVLERFLGPECFAEQLYPIGCDHSSKKGESARMATPGRAEDPDLNRSLMEEILREDACSFEFFQAVTLLQRLRHRIANRWADFPILRTKPFISVSTTNWPFPPARFRRLRWQDDSPPQMTVNFMGLTGPMGVLPYCYTELILERLRAKDKSSAVLPGYLQPSHDFSFLQGVGEISISCHLLPRRRRPIHASPA